MCSPSCLFPSSLLNHESLATQKYLSYIPITQLYPMLFISFFIAGQIGKQSASHPIPVLHGQVSGECGEANL